MSREEAEEAPSRSRARLVGAPFSEPPVEAVPPETPCDLYERAFSFSPASSQAQEESLDDVISITLDEPEDVEEEVPPGDSPDRAAGEGPGGGEGPVRGVWESLGNFYAGTKESWVYCSVAVRLLRRRCARALPASLLRRSWAALRERLELNTCKKRRQQRPVSSVLPESPLGFLLEDKKQF